MSIFFEFFFYTLALCFVLQYLWNKFTQPSPHDLEQALAEIENSIIMCKVEQEGDTFYLYNATDEKFVGQGNSMQNFQVLSENLQKHIMIVAGDDDVVDRFQKLDPESVIERV